MPERSRHDRDNHASEWLADENPYPMNHRRRLQRLPANPVKPVVPIDMFSVITGRRAATATVGNTSVLDHGRPVVYMASGPRDVNLSLMSRLDDGRVLSRIAIGVPRFENTVISEILDRDPLARLHLGPYGNDIPEKRFGAWQVSLGMNATAQFDDDIKVTPDLIKRYEQALAYGVLASAAPSAEGPHAVPDNSAVHHVARLVGFDVPVNVSGSNMAYRLPQAGMMVDDHLVPRIPPMYGEDWHGFRKLIGVVDGIIDVGECTQFTLGDGLTRVMTPERAMSQEGTDAYLEGLFWLDAMGLDPRDPKNWQQHLDIRREWFAKIRGRLEQMPETDLTSLARKTLEAATFRLSQVTAESCVRLFDRLEKWDKRIGQAVLDGDELVRIKWLHIGKFMPSSLEAGWGKAGVSFSVVDSKLVAPKPARRRRIRSERVLPARPGGMGMPNIPMRQLPVAAFAENVMKQVFGQEVRPASETNPVSKVRPLIEIFKEVNSGWRQREALLDTTTNRYLPFIYGIDAPVLRAVDVKALAEHQPVWNELLSEAGHASEQAVRGQREFDNEDFRFYRDLSKEMNTARRLTAELAIAAPEMGSNALYYAEVACGAKSTRRAATRWENIAKWFEAGDIPSLERWIDFAFRDQGAFHGSTFGYWDRTTGFRPGDLLREQPQGHERAEMTFSMDGDTKGEMESDTLT